MGTRGRPRRRRSRPGPNGRRPDRGRSGDDRHSVPELAELSPFSLFCALYLGITENDGYAEQDARSVASRFGLEPAELAAYLERHRLRERDLRAVNFDLQSARLDIQVAPEGISRTELARTLFAEIKSVLPDPEPDPAPGHGGSGAESRPAGVGKS